MSYQDRKALRKAVVEAAARCFRAQHSFDDENVQRLLRDIGRNLKLALDATDATPPAPGWVWSTRAIWLDGPDSEAARAARGEGSLSRDVHALRVEVGRLRREIARSVTRFR